MMERLGELVTHFSEAVPQLTSVVENLRVFKTNFERDLHRNQVDCNTLCFSRCLLVHLFCFALFLERNLDEAHHSCG